MQTKTEESPTRERKRGDRIKVGVVGATGMVGQRFVQLLSDHPWFELTAVAASSSSAGKSYKEAVDWKVSPEIPQKARELTVGESAPPLDCELVFSSLPGSVAGEVEEEFARAGYPLFSNASSHRMDRLIPLVIPEVNPDHLGLIEGQKEERGWSGFIVNNPNCSAVGLTMVLKPLQIRFGLEKVMVVTQQALSGAGYPGEASLDMVGNVLPSISGEEEKLATEPLKMLGSLREGGIERAEIAISPQCSRVNVADGHLETISFALKKEVGLEDVKRSFSSFRPETEKLDLPSSPKKALVLLEGDDRPQPRLDVERGAGMSTSIGRVRECPVLDYKLVLLSHNTIRGAAGGSLLNAELAWRRGYLND